MDFWWHEVRYDVEPREQRLSLENPPARWRLPRDSRGFLRALRVVGSVRQGAIEAQLHRDNRAAGNRGARNMSAVRRADTIRRSRSLLGLRVPERTGRFVCIFTERLKE